MKTLNYLLILVVFFTACNKKEDTKATEEVIPLYTISQFMDTELIMGGSFSPDETKILFSSDRTGVINSYSISVEGGEPKALTSSSTNYNRSLSYFPEDERFLITSDNGGNEINHIFVVGKTGNQTDIIADSAAKANFYGWAHDKKSFFYTSNSRDARYFDLYEVDVEGSGEQENPVLASSLLMENKMGHGISAISPNKRYVVLSEPKTTSTNNMYLFDRETNESKLLNPEDSEADYNAQYFSLDNKKLYYLTDEGSEFAYLKALYLETGESENVFQTDWDVMYAYQSESGKYRVIAINNDAKTQIRIDDMEKGEEVKLANIPEGDITSVEISPSENKMLFYMSSSSSPSNLFVYDFEKGSTVQLSNSLSEEIDSQHLVSGEVIRFNSYDGLEIPSILYKPKQVKEGEKLPALLFIHGGPGGQTRLNYTPRIQYWVNHGYVVLAVNNRGSSGYGKSFYKADDLKHGDVDLRDCIESKKFLAATGYVDENKIGIAGGSYGGYMVMAALAFAPEEFAVGVNYFGVTNWIRTLKSVPPWWESFKDALYQELGNPYEDSVALYNKSPLYHADKITKPFIVLQGSNDPRVLQVESDEIVEAARTNNVPVEYVVFEDEGHGFRKKENQIKASESVLKFLDTYLK